MFSASLQGWSGAITQHWRREGPAGQVNRVKLEYFLSVLDQHVRKLLPRVLVARLDPSLDIFGIQVQHRVEA